MRLVKKFIPVTLFILIISLSVFLRLYQLGQDPPSLDWDEASLGWNAYSILKTGTDEYGKAWPVSIRSFNDYKPPMYVYATIPSVAVFGLNEFSVRLPSAIAGVLTVLVTFFLVRTLTNNKLLSYLVTFLLAISPWSIQFSRVAFEANLALFFFVLGSFSLSLFLEKHDTKTGKILLAACVLAYTFSIYSYHSSRLVVPLFVTGILLWRFRLAVRHWKLLTFCAVLTLVLLYPLARNTINTKSLTARFSDVSIFAQDKADMTVEKIVPLFAKNYLDHFNFDFLFLTGDANVRHHAPDMGVLYLWEAPFLLLGFLFLFKTKPKWGFFVLWWLLTAPVASALTMPTPHAIRSLLFLPTFQIITGFGILRFIESVKSLKPIPMLFLCLVSCVLYLGNIFYYLDQYFVQLPVEYARDWQYGYKEAVKKVLALEHKYNQIYITSYYDQPYIYFLFYGRISPVVKNDGLFYLNMDKYRFDVNIDDKKNLFVIAPEDEENIKPFKVLDTVYFPDGKPAFLLGKRT